MKFLEFHVWPEHAVMINSLHLLLLLLSLPGFYKTATFHMSGSWIAFQWRRDEYIPSQPYLQTSWQRNFLGKDRYVFDVIRAYRSLSYWLSFSIIDFVFVVNDTRPASVKVVCNVSFALKNIFASTNTYTHTHNHSRCSKASWTWLEYIIM
jgi:hypothetical protein